MFKQDGPVAKQKVQKLVASFSISNDSNRLVEVLAGRLGCSKSEVVERCLNAVWTGMQTLAPIVRSPVLLKALQGMESLPEVRQEWGRINALVSRSLPGNRDESLPQLGSYPREPGAEDLSGEAVPLASRVNVQRRRPYKRDQSIAAVSL